MSLSPSPRLSRRHRLSIYWIAALLLITGIFWLVLNVGTEFRHSSTIAYPWLSIQLGLAHDALGLMFIAAFGSLLPAHLPAGWTSQRNRWSGIGLIAILAILVATGWFLHFFIFGYEWQYGLRRTHWVLGLIPLVLLPWHSRRYRG